MIGIKFNVLKRFVGAAFWLGLSVTSAVASSYGEISLQASSKQTYAATSDATTLATSATDFFTLYGSSSKTVKVLKISAYNYSTGGNWIPLDKIRLIKRSSTASGGTSTTLTAVPLDSQNAAATATAKIYTANPTVGSAVGTICIRRAISLIQSAYLQPDNMQGRNADVFDYQLIGQPIVLRGASEGIALNLDGVTQQGTSPSMLVNVIWTEE